MASSAAFTYAGEYYPVPPHLQLIKVKGSAWIGGEKLFKRQFPTLEDGTEVDESA